MHISKKREEWEKDFYWINNLLQCYLTCVYDELDQGETTPEIISFFVKHERADNVLNLLKELNEFLSLVEKGKIDPDQYLEEIGSETMYDWDRLAASKNFSTLDYFKFIRTLLIENMKKQYDT